VPVPQIWSCVGELGGFPFPGLPVGRGAKIGAAGRHHRRFAPGGRGSRLLREVLPRNPRSRAAQACAESIREDLE
jgi:hypothetical protein